MSSKIEQYLPNFWRPFSQGLVMVSLTMSCLVLPVGAQENLPALRLDVQQAVMMALERNQSLKVQRLAVQLAETQEQEQAAVFDPVITADNTVTSENAQRQLGAAPDFLDVLTDSQSASAGISKRFASGTTIGLDFSSTLTRRAFNNNLTNQQITRAGISFTQALLRGMNTQVNLASVEQAKLDTAISRYELQGFAQNLAADTEKAFWDLALAQQQLRIFEESLKLAQQQLKETQERIKLGKLAGIEETAAQAEVLLREQDLITAKATIERSRLALLRLLNPRDQNWSSYPLELVEVPELPNLQLDTPETHVSLALVARPEVRQTQLLIDRQELEVVRTRDGLLPRLDLFINLGKTGYANNFPMSMLNLTRSAYDLSVGVQLEYPLGNRQADARYQRAQLTHEQSQEALTNLRQSIETEVRNTYIEVLRLRDQVRAARATRELQLQKVQIETERYRVGSSTAFIVAQAQRDLLNSRIGEVLVIVNLMKNISDFYRLEGSLLERRGVQVLHTP